MSSSEPQAAPFSHDQLDRVLQARVDLDGRVDYAGLKASRAPLDAYVDSLGRCSPRNCPDRFPTTAHGLAYWVNAYNAFVLQGIADAYPVDSVSDIGLLDGVSGTYALLGKLPADKVRTMAGLYWFFRWRTFAAGGEHFTLHQIENEIIRPLYREPRIHVAINCGSVSCPRLAQRAFTAEALPAQLEQAMRRFAHDPDYVRLDRQRDRLHLSRILDWYGQDFAPTVVDYLLPYLPEADADYLRRRPGVEISFDDYDWSLNDQVLRQD